MKSPVWGFFYFTLIKGYKWDIFATVMRILMVCLGNICRSPIAEGVMRHKIAQHGLDWTVASAGTESYHIGEAPHCHSQKVCTTYGVDISAQRARKFTAADISKYDRVYAMAADVYEEIKQIVGRNTNLDNVHLFLNELHPGSDASVPDPWYGNEDGYLPVYQMIEQTCNAIIEKYK
jgi:protein-tyrosine phosphatase